MTTWMLNALARAPAERIALRDTVRSLSYADLLSAMRHEVIWQREYRSASERYSPFDARSGALTANGRVRREHIGQQYAHFLIPRHGLARAS